MAESQITLTIQQPQTITSWCKWKSYSYSTQSTCSFLFISPSTAPCVPRNAKGGLDCVSNSAWVTWDASEGAHSYYVLAQGGGDNSSCTTTSSPCNVPDLKCGTLYTFHVTAVNKQCRSNHSSTFELETGIQQESLLSMYQFCACCWKVTRKMI